MQTEKTTSENYFAKARYNMVYNQLIPSGIDDEKIINAFLKVPKHKFVAVTWQDVAYIDGIIPVLDPKVFVDNCRYIIPPLMLGKMLQFAGLEHNSKVLDINCSTGYSSVLISNLVKGVIAVDEDQDLLKIASSKELLSSADGNITYKLLANFTHNWADDYFDAIIVNGIMNEIPKFLEKILANDGKIILIEKSGQVAKIVKHIKHNDKMFKDELCIADADDRLYISKDLL